MKLIPRKSRLLENYQIDNIKASKKNWFPEFPLIPLINHSFEYGNEIDQNQMKLLWTWNLILQIVAKL